MGDFDTRFRCYFTFINPVAPHRSNDFQADNNKINPPPPPPPLLAICEEIPPIIDGFPLQRQ